MQWKPVRDRDKYGVAIHNYCQEKCMYRIKVNVGDTVHILEEAGDWYFGYATHNKSQRGIFPKGFIQIRDSVIDISGNSEVVIPRQPPVVHEITSVLREWGHIWKYLYVNAGSEFQHVRLLMYELVTHRSKILSGTLPVDELKELKHLVTSKIDLGNSLLGLDLVVRDEQGNLLNPDVTSTMQLYKQHDSAVIRIKKHMVHSTAPKSAFYHNRVLCLSVRNFTCKVSDNLEICMVLYDVREGKPITENYYFPWRKESNDDPDKNMDLIDNARVAFSDLGGKDVNCERLYLVAYIIRIGLMEIKDTEKEAKATRKNKVLHKEVDVMRRPFGVAVKDVTDILKGKVESDESKIHFMPFVQCGERDHLDSTLRKLLAGKDVSHKENKGQGFYITLRMVHGDFRQIREELPHFVLGSLCIAKKMGFPEVILPGDVRNDLYLTLVGGEFSKGSKSADKNVQVTVQVYNDRAHLIHDAMKYGAGSEPRDKYNSVIYYHEDKPKWFETLKISIPIDIFYNCHIKCTFQHRSTNDTKDRTEKPFGVSFIKLMQENGTTLKDTQHDLFVYKIDHKKFENEDPGYLRLPWRRGDDISRENKKFHYPGLSLSNKDSFSVCTTVCSTKLTQNVELLGLLKWWAHESHLEESLKAFMKVDGEEVVKFLQDVLDALFNILMKMSQCDMYDNLVFESLIYIIGLVSDRKYQHFQPVLDVYIKDNFSATLAYSKLIAVLKYYVDNAVNPECHDILLKAMKCVQYLFKFIVRSRQLFAILYEGKCEESFEESLHDLLASLGTMMLHTVDSTLLSQGACLKYLPSAIPDILSVFDPKALSGLLVTLINNIPPYRLSKQKMMTINELVHGRLFLFSECRLSLLPMVVRHVRDLLKGREEVELCVKILNDVMEVLHRKDLGVTNNDIELIMTDILRTIIQTVVDMDKEDPLSGNMIAVMMSIFRQMGHQQYKCYLEHFPLPTDITDFLMEIMMVFKELVTRCVYPSDWCEMIMLQNSIILKSLRFFSHTIQDRYTRPFEAQIWSNYFDCSIAFLTQPALQLETFSQNKRSRILARYKDMRREMGFEIRTMWFNLGQHKINFVPSMVGPFLEMTLVPETELRKATIPIFFDMMQCEFYSPRKQGENYSDSKWNSSNIKAAFSEFENEMIAKLDTLVEGGRGDAQYKSLFQEILGCLCENHATLKELGMHFVNIVAQLMERLLEYRTVIMDENKENRMSCTVNLLDFYEAIQRQEMYIRYLHKLRDLHLECDNYTEAAFTLRLHSKLLNWSDETLPPLLRSSKYHSAHTHRQLKEALYVDIIDYFDRGKMWECALTVCKEFLHQLEEEQFDYTRVSPLLQRMSLFYDNIMKQVRPEPEYFRVAFYGRGFPAFLQNKVFVYRGKEYERLIDFCTRTLNQFPNAELMGKLDMPSDDVLESPLQFLQINKIDPIMDDKLCFMGKAISAQILRYHRVNDICRYMYARPFHRSTGISDNEFASLWLERTIIQITYPLPGILQWFPVIPEQTRIVEVSPLQNAIETMDNANQQLRELIVAHRNDPSLPLNPLSLKLSGIVDSPIMGGIGNYEKAFFTPEYALSHSEETPLVLKLQDLVAAQVPLIDVGLQVHKLKASVQLQKLQQHMEERFQQLKIHVESKYGCQTCDVKLDWPTSTNAFSSKMHLFGKSSLCMENGLDDNITSSNESRLSSLSQVSTLSKGLFSQSFTNINSPLINRSASVTSNRYQGGFIPNPPSQFPSLTSISSQVINATKNSKDKKHSKKEKKEKNKERESVPILLRRNSETQWYTSGDRSDIRSESAPIIQLNQQLTPERPLRSEAEKERRFSRPTSGHFTILKGNRSNSPSKSNRDSVATTDSTISTTSEEDIPPPLPQKQREIQHYIKPRLPTDGEEPDYCNLPPLKDDKECQPLPDKAARLLGFGILESTSHPELLDKNPPPTPPKKPHLHVPMD